MNKILLLTFFCTFIFSQNITATPVDVVKKEAPTEVAVQSKKKKKKKKFFARMTEKIMKRRVGKMIKKLGLDPNECDRIITTEGEEIEVVIVKIGSELIRYKKCDFQNGPTRSIRNEDVFMIKYADGKKVLMTDIEELKENQKKAVRTANQEEDNFSHYWGIGFLIGILLGLLGLLVLAIALDGERRNRALRGALAGILTTFLLIITFALLIFSFG